MFTVQIGQVTMNRTTIMYNLDSSQIKLPNQAQTAHSDQISVTFEPIIQF